MLRKAAGRAIDRGLEFLDTTVAEDGSWPSRRYANHELAGPATPDRPPAPFVAAMGVLHLGECGDPRAAALAALTRRHLLSRIEYPGVWRYWPFLPPDQDDTAICSLAVPSHYWVRMGKNIPVILAHRDREGRFMTWMAPEDPSRGIHNDIDSVVNANVIAHLGANGETRGAQRWLESLIEEGRESNSSPWYVFSMDLYVALVRANRLAAPAFARLRATLADRILRCRDDDGEYDDVWRTAQAASALLSLGFGSGDERIRPSVERLIDAQGPHGGWPECLAWRGPSVPRADGSDRRVGFASEALTTACCIETLARFLRDP